MADTTEKQKSFIDDVKDELSWLRDKIKNTWNDLLKNLWLKEDKEKEKVETKTKKELDNLSKKLIDIEINKLKDKELNIEGDLDKLDDETTILWLLARNNENIKSWFEWLKDVDDEDTKSWEIEMVLLSLKEISNNDTDNSEWDLTEQELKEIWENTKKKMELCDKVLNTVKNDDSIPEDKRTKKAILEAYSSILSENNWNISQVTDEKIINKLKEKIEPEE